MVARKKTESKETTELKVKEEKQEKPKKKVTKKTEKIVEANVSPAPEKKAKAHQKEVKEAVELAIQPEINIGLVGHVDHGKTTLTERLSGKWTDTHSEEVKRGITIRLGYADSTFVNADGEITTEEKAKKEKKEYTFLRKVSFVDAPGHESLMATMLAGATLMDGALLLVAANEKCPQPQTREHLMALKIIGIKNIIVIQNKIDLVAEDEAIENYNQIKTFLKGTDYENAPIIPISAQHNINIDLVISAIIEHIPTPKRDMNAQPRMFIARSFDVNRPGTQIKDLKGGILGGALSQGIIKEGEEVEIRPGHIYEEANKKVWKPIRTKAFSLMTGGKQVKELGPGGSIAILTSLDPSIVKADSFTGHVLGHADTLPDVWNYLKLKINLLERVVGAAEDLKVEPIKMGEILMLNVNSAATVGIVAKLSKDVIECTLKLPVCADNGARVTISRRVGTRFRLIGYGLIQ
jgi:translation initiation factor 2 subunit 3